MSDFSLKTFMLNVVLWLPLAFFLWFYLSGALIAPVDWSLSAVFSVLYPDLVHEVVREEGYWLQIGVLVDLPEGRAVADIPVNPMIYGYGLPLVAGLAISTPVSAGYRTTQVLVTWLAVIAIQVWGSFWETFRTLAFSMGEPGRTVQEAAGMPAELIALCYQFGYLILPAVLPIALWILMNRRFIEGVVNYRVETPGSTKGQ